MAYAYLSLGSNTEDAELMLGRARHVIGNISHLHLVSVSPVFWTEPQQYKNQPWFLNQCVKLETGHVWTAEKLLERLLEIELTLGRKREKETRFGPRAIDIDMLLFDGQSSFSAYCHLPHERMHKRAFVLLPLYVMEPKLLLYGKDLSYWLSLLDWKIRENRIYQSNDNGD